MITWPFIFHIINFFMLDLNLYRISCATNINCKILYATGGVFSLFLCICKCKRRFTGNMKITPYFWSFHKFSSEKKLGLKLYLTNIFTLLFKHKNGLCVQRFSILCVNSIHIFPLPRNFFGIWRTSLFYLLC